MAPCTDWFLAFTRLAGGNTSLGAALIPINMIAQLLLYPVYLYLFGINEIGIGTGDIVATIMQWFLVPLLLAQAMRFIITRALSESIVDTVETAVSALVPLTLALLVGMLTAANVSVLLANSAVVPLVLASIFVFFTLVFFVSEGFAKLMKFAHADRVLLTMTTSARNAPLMLVVTMAVMPGQPLVYAAIIIGMMVDLPHLVALKVVLQKRYSLGWGGERGQAR